MKIQSAYPTLAEAVAASTIDLSYNKRAALDHIQMFDAPPRASERRGLRATHGAFITDEGKVFVCYTADDLRFCMEFDPFCGVLHDGPLEATTIHLTPGYDIPTPERKYTNDNEGRALARIHCANNSNLHILR